MKKVLAFLLACIAGNAAVASSVSNSSVISNAIDILADDAMRHQETLDAFYSLCSASTCHRAIVENSKAAAFATVALLQCFALPALVTVESLSEKHPKPFAPDTSSVLPKDNSRAVVLFKKGAQLRNINIRRNGRLQQP